MMTINGYKFLSTISIDLNYRTTQHLPNTDVKTISNSSLTNIKIYNNEI